MEKMSYEQLVNIIEEMRKRMTKWDVVCLIINYKNKITKQDIENIEKLYGDNFIDN